jgi:hypothetical protein
MAAAKSEAMLRRFDCGGMRLLNGCSWSLEAMWSITGKRVEQQTASRK